MFHKPITISSVSLLFVGVCSPFARATAAPEPVPTTTPTSYLKLVAALEKQVDSSSSEEARNGFKQELAWNLSFVGDYGRATQTFASAFSPPAPAQPTAEDAAALRSGLPFLDPVESICAAVESRRILIVNEAHHHPDHRVLGQRLLPCLKRLGFKYAAFETLGEETEAINARGFVTRNTGWYSAEPQMARLINDALRLGFKVVRYEARNFCSSCTQDDQIDQREEEQASNLESEIFKRDEKAKAFIWVGFAHAYKHQLTDSGKSRWMAARLWEKTGIEPYSVEQISEGFALNSWNQYYETLMQPEYPKQSVFLDVAARWSFIPTFFQPSIAHTFDLKPAVDALVLHPRQTLKSTRWQWLETPPEEQLNVIFDSSSLLEL